MTKILLAKIKEALVSVLPVAAIVLLLNLTPLVNFTGLEMGVFVASAFFLILGIGLFNMGADLAMTPMGEQIGSGLTKSGNLPVLLTVCFAMGLLITVAEPDLSVLANQVGEVLNGTLLIMTVGAGVGLFLIISVIKMVTHKPLSSLLLFFYMVLFMLTALVIINENTDFLPLAFDSGGVTTGPITVPFIMALGVGIATTLGGKNVGENSFGLIAMCSIGPIIAVMLLGVTASGDMSYAVPDYSVEAGLGSALFETVLHTFKEVAIALGLIVAFFIVLQLVCLKLPKKRLLQIAVGIIYTYIGLVVFLTAVKVGFVPIGFKMGTELAGNHPAFVIGFGFIIGMVVVLAEPAVHVLNKQVEDITDGTVSKKSMMIALSVGVGISLGLSMLRVVFDFSILYYVIPGYLISLGLSFFVPGLYTAIAFDSGGVASGPLTSSFILPFAIGVCCMLQGEVKVMSDAFGIVAMVAMTPLITIQLLGFRAVVKKTVQDRIAMRRILNADDEQIIDFN
ncbi:MAG: DUF1538 domain-containing protein [Ruminococcaceae bacterium]|nr:DUF1538 domain-containing protein [Oscillospiraceae bacterium]